MQIIDYFRGMILETVCRLVKWYTYILDEFSNSSRCRAYEAVESLGMRRHVEAWAGYIAMEIAEGHITEARTLYKCAHSRKFEENGQARICAL